MTTAPIPEVDVHAARALAADGAVLLDVREHHEWDEMHIDGARHVPLGELTLPDVPTGPVVLVCRSGNRSGQATRALIEAGRTDVVNMSGGMLAWVEQALPVVAGAGRRV